MAKLISSATSQLPRLSKGSTVRRDVAVPVVPIGAAFSIERFASNINLDIEGSIKEAVRIGTQKLGIELNSKLDEAMESSGWGWTEGTRDIVDTGRLKNSAQINIKEDMIEISYEAPYAAIVHYGGYIQPYGNKNARPVYIPGRPWIESLINGDGPIGVVPYEQIYYGAFDESFK
jgi:hypothetical protein